MKKYTNKELKQMTREELEQVVSDALEEMEELSRKIQEINGETDRREKSDG